PPVGPTVGHVAIERVFHCDWRDDPQRGLSRATRRTSSRMSAEIASWPGRRPAYVQPAVPTKQCVRADEEGLLARSPQKSTGRSEEDTISVLRARAGDLSAKDRKLMSEHDDHELLEITRTQTQRR